MANQQHLEHIFKGETHWNRWRRQHPHTRPDLSHAHLISIEIKGTPLSHNHTGAFLPCIDLSLSDLMSISLDRANLYGANLSGANGQHAGFSDADLSYADLRGVNLSYVLLFSTNFTNADLSGADLSHAYLNKANLSGANLSGANLGGALLHATHLMNVRLNEATVGWTMFANVDLSSVQGLETLKHEGPSSLGFDTILRSKGTLPASFLFQVGLDQAMIAMVQQHLQQSLSLPSCSLGYTLADQAFALQFQASMQATGIPCWPVALDIPLGALRPTAATDFISRYNRLILILSQAAVESEEIQEEVQTAVTMETQRGERVLFPIAIDDAALSTRQEWILNLREHHPFLDFTGWEEEESYQQKFQQLLHAMQA